MGKKKQQHIERYASAISSKGQPDKFGMIYESMVKHEKFNKLSIGAKWLYVLCRIQLNTKKQIQCRHNHEDEIQKAGADIRYDYERDFVFPAKQLKEYNIQRQNAYKYFNELEEHGFIERKERNGIRQKVNVYSFSDKWFKGT